MRRIMIDQDKLICTATHNFKVDAMDIRPVFIGDVFISGSSFPFCMKNDCKYAITYYETQVYILYRFENRDSATSV